MKDNVKASFVLSKKQSRLEGLTVSISSKQVVFHVFTQSVNSNYSAGHLRHTREGPAGGHLKEKLYNIKL